ncbi:MAG: cadmium-translocating P-type ATPase [Maricaulaceae bacterium]|nr:cadmium-translocating P-type ATPase [Maricaulaceae bacterium]
MAGVGAASVRLDAASALQADPQAFVREREGRSEIDLLVRGAHCAGCIARIEGGLSALPGVRQARLNLSSGRLALAWDGGPGRAREFVAKLHEMGFGAAPYAPETLDGKKAQEERELLLAMGVAGFATGSVMLISVSVWAGAGEMDEALQSFFHWVSALIVLPAVAFSGRPFFRSAIASIRARRINMDVPISLGVLMACGLSIVETIGGRHEVYFEAAAMLLFFLLIGRFLDSRLRARAGAAAHRLAALQAVTANRIAGDGRVMAVPAGDVRPGDRLLVAAGDRVPVDAEVLEGESTLDAALVTGETAPAAAAPGAKLYSGMVNLGQPLVVRAAARREDSLLAEIARLVETGEQGRSRYVRLADRAARLYAPIVHAIAAATLLGWLLLMGDARAGIINAIAVLIITCPCALALAVPAVQVVASGRLYRAGVLVKSGDALERLAEADYAVFDKTGTLTAGRPRLINREAISAEVLETAARLARASRHPVSRAVADAAGAGPIAGDVRETPGGGLEATVDGRRVRFGSAAWLGIESGGAPESEAWLAVEGVAPVRFAFADEPRAGAAETLAAFAAAGIPCELLSGDREAAVADMASRLGVTRWKAGLKPQDKIARLQALAAEGRKVIMLGDGINDAPALAGAHVSISLAAAADISQAASDFVLQGERLDGAIAALRVSRDARARVKENFAMTAVYNAVAVPLGVFGFVTPLIAAIAMSGSSMLVTLNAMRLARR